jgi:hypothetical protein
MRVGLPGFQGAVPRPIASPCHFSLLRQLKCSPLRLVFLQTYLFCLNENVAFGKLRRLRIWPETVIESWQHVLRPPITSPSTTIKREMQTNFGPTRYGVPQTIENQVRSAITPDGRNAPLGQGVMEATDIESLSIEGVWRTIYFLLF